MTDRTGPAAADSAPRLYLVTPATLDPEAFADTLATCLSAGLVACVRLDLGPVAAEDAWIAAANHLLPVCHAADVPLVVAEHHRLVLPLGLDGVHLGQSRTTVRELRRSLGSDRIVGAFGGQERHRAMTLAEAGADYVSLGPVRAGGQLGDGALAGDELFRWWAEMIETPVVAEGGVALEDARRLAEVADFVVPDPATLWSDPDPAAVLRAYADALA